MRSIFIAIPLLLVLPVAEACPPFDVPAQFRAEWANASQNYKKPRGRMPTLPPSARAQLPGGGMPPGLRCDASVDLTGDGDAEFAAVFDYTGEQKRVQGWSQDLVFMMRRNGRVERVVFPFAGQTANNDGTARTYLAIQPPGTLDLRPGTLVLQRPAVVLYRDGEPAVVYYWDGDEIAQQAIGVDD